MYDCVLSPSHFQDIARIKKAGWYIELTDDGFVSLHVKGMEVLDRGGFTTNSPGTRPHEPNGFAYPKRGGGWVVCRLGTRAEAETDYWYPNAELYATCQIPPPRPTITLGEEKDTTDEACEALSGVPGIGQRGGALVRVLKGSPTPEKIERPRTTPYIEALPTAMLREALTVAATYQKRDSKTGKLVRCGPPTWLVNAVESRGEWPVPTLEGITEVPLLLSDGTLTRPGFDTASGIHFAPCCEFGELVSIDQAIETLFDVVTDFPFATPAHKSAYLAAVLTPLARPAFSGPAPLFMLEGNTPGVGKNLLADLIGEQSAGRVMARMSAPDSDDEWRKRITSIAMSGELVVLIDNVTGHLKSPSLDAALTSQVWSDRLLGKNQTVRAPLLTTWFLTGNNVMLANDTIRRTLHIRLQTDLERPEQRTGFKYANVIEHVRQNRGRFTMAALSILHGYHAAGRPDLQLAPWGSFEGWSNLIRNAIAWAGLPDPGETRTTLAARNDDESEFLATLIAGLEEAGKALTTQEMFDEAHRFPTLKAAIDELPNYNTKHALGQRLKRLQDRPLGGKRIIKVQRGKIITWTVQ